MHLHQIDHIFIFLLVKISIALHYFMKIKSLKYLYVPLNFFTIKLPAIYFKMSIPK